MMLSIRALETGYGPASVLFGIDLDVPQGQVVTLLGRNGMGKTTTIRSIMGLLPPRGGTISFHGQTITGLPPHRIAQMGIGLVPEGRQVFVRLSVEENLVATSADRRNSDNPWTLERVYDFFPRLRERHEQYAGTLSGGEQQMLAIGRALMTNPRLLILDEATEGLAPIIRADIWACLDRLKAEGLSILIVDRNLNALIRLADLHHVIEKGRIVWRGTSAQLTEQRHLVEEKVGV